MSRAGCIRHALGLAILCALRATTALAAAEADPAAAKPAPDTWTITGSFTPATPLKRYKPLYPRRAVTNAMGGWVRASFCVDRAGNVVDPVIDASSRAGDFEPNALAAIRRWTYRPAQFHGQPIRVCGLQVMLAFNMSGEKGARAEFVTRWRKLGADVTAGHLGDATPGFDALIPWNNYEEARLDVLRATIARAKGDSQAELHAWTAALELRDNLEPDLLADALHRTFRLNLEAKQFAKALKVYGQLERNGAQTDGELDAMQQLPAFAASNATLATPVVIGPDDRVGGRTAWRTPLLRSAFEFNDATGDLARIEVRCAEHWYASPFAMHQTWNIPLSWGACGLFVYGDEGATATLLEFPPDGDGAPVRPVDP